jgi:hypothetical protein
MFGSKKAISHPYLLHHSVVFSCRTQGPGRGRIFRFERASALCTLTTTFA